MTEITDQIKEHYKEHARFYQQYDMPPQWKTQPIASKEPNLDPFKKINWKNLYDANKQFRLFYKEKNGQIVWSYICVECKTNRGVKDVAEDIVGRIKTGDLQITRFAYADGYKDDLINDIQGKREIENALLDSKRDIWFTDVNMELDKDKDLCHSIKATWLSSKVTAVGSEVRGIWYCGDMKQEGMSPYEGIKIKKIGILGIAFKSDIDDTRDSLSIDLLNFLRSKSLKVNISDDYVKNKEIVDKIKLINESDIIILGVPHSSYRKIKIPKNKFLVDSWGFFEK